MKLSILSIAMCMLCISISAQTDRWQQYASYKMEIDFDDQNHQFEGKQEIKYKNNSPDTLHRVFYHLFFNAFQPGSMMDMKSLNVGDPDKRVGDRISKLSPKEIGYHKISSLTQDGKPLRFEVVGTILEVRLDKPLNPGKSTKLSMEFESQVPVQIRRSGRNNKEGISYSMTQWYPKLCEYDYQGWHAHPYVGREFHGVWGDFDVKIKLPKKYIMGATGTLQNPSKIRYGYQDDAKDSKKGPKGLGKNAEWHWKAEKVHDFAWAADPDYTHMSATTKAGTKLHYLYQDNEETHENWNNLHPAMDEAEQYLNENFGEYPFPSYTFIQGGDGGMEYPMITLITGLRSYGSLVGVSIHEWVHSWYQMVLATNEALYPWMDEGFTSFASAETSNHLRAKGILDGDVRANPLANSAKSFARFTQSGLEEPLSTHSDHYSTNTAYGVASYTKGAVFLKQLEYIIGVDNFKKGMLRYYDEWKFKHPNPNDFIRVMEKTSDIELDWYKEYFVYSTKTIDYSIDTVQRKLNKTMVKLSKVGEMPMPVDLLIKMKDGTDQIINIPLRIMRAHKPNEKLANNYTLSEDWPWTNPHYDLALDIDFDLIESITIDHLGRVADTNVDNNVFPRIVKEEDGK